MPLRSFFAGVGYYLPERTMTTEDVNRKIHETTGFVVNNGIIERLTGVRTRHYRAKDEQSSDLALNAATRALDQAGVDREEVDLLIFAACSQDITEPATANILQEKLGCSKAQVLDVKNACNSFLSGVDVADSHVRIGKARCALIAVGETLSLSVDWSIRSSEDFRPRIAGLTLGDAGAAVVLRANDLDDGRGILTTRFRSYGEKWRLATVLGGGSMYQFADEHSTFRSESQALRDAAYELIPGVVEEALDSVGWKPGDIDVICAHQVTEEMVLDIAEQCGCRKEAVVMTVTDCGNTAAASIPLCLGRASEDGMLTRGAKVLLVGGAAGFSVGVIPLVW